DPAPGHHRPFACVSEQDLAGARDSRVQTGHPRDPTRGHQSHRHRRDRDRPRVLHHDGGWRAADRLAPDRDPPCHGKPVRADQLRHRRPRRSRENVGQPGWRPDIGGDHQRRTTLRRQPLGGLRDRVPRADPGPPVTARGHPPMRLPSIRSFGPTVWGIGLFLILLAGLAPRTPDFLLTLVIGLLIWATLAYSLNLITGLTGYVSFGHVVFMALGGYALAFGVGTWNLHSVAGVALGAVVGAALRVGLGALS